MPHTPGPWKRLYTDRVTTIDDENGSKSIAHIYESGGCQDANANLIAAAPRQHDVLASLVQWWDGAKGTMQELREIISEARAAIAAAEGKEGGET